MVPVDQGRRRASTSPASTPHYEDLITKTRENKLTADDFQGTNITLTNPGGLGTVASVPRLMQRPGHDRRHRLDRLPGRVGPRHRRPDQGARRLEGDDDDVHLRPPDHPGRRVGLVPAARSTSSCRARTSSTSASPTSSTSRPQAVTNAHPASASAPARWRAAGGGTRRSPGAIVRGRARPGAAPGGAGRDLAAQGLPHPRRTSPRAVNPLGGEPKGDPALEPENLNLTPELMSRIPASILRIGVEGETLLEALPRMRDAYCGTIAYQIEHLSSHQQRMWLREMIETGSHRQPLTRGGEARAAAPPDSRCSSSSASCRRPTSARRCSRSRAST